MAAHGIQRPDAMTREELLSLPTVIDIPTANRALGLGRSTGYELAKQGRYPCKILKAGRSYRVVTADLLRVLEIEQTSLVLTA